MFAHEEKEMIYRVYITEALKHYLKLNIGYYELINKKDSEEETRSADEIKQRFKDRLSKQE